MDRLGWAHARESGLDDEEGGVDEDEQDALLYLSILEGDYDHHFPCASSLLFF